MLNSRTVVKVDVPEARLAFVSKGRPSEKGQSDLLLDLRFLLAQCGLVDRHLYDLVLRGHDNGLESREVGANVFVVYGPKSVEPETSLITIQEVST